MLLIVARNEITTAIALTKLGLNVKTLHCDRLCSDGLEEDVFRLYGVRRFFLFWGILGALYVLREAKGKFYHFLFVIQSIELSTVQLDLRQYVFDERRAIALAVSLTNNKQATNGTGKGYIEQIQVVYRVLQVLIKVGRLVDGALHLLLAIINRGYGQCVKRLNTGFAP